VAMQYSVTYNTYNNWTIPFKLAIGFHLVVAFSVLFLPGLLKSKPKHEDIYTVNLINISESVFQEEVTPPPEIAPAPVVPPPSTKAIPIAAPKKPAAPVQTLKPVSIKPLKRKLKKKVIPVKDPVRQKELERKKRQTIAEALKAEQEALRQAQLAADEAARQQKLLEKQLTEIKKQGSSSPKPTKRSESSTLSGLDRQYLANVQGRLLEFWSLPQYKNWDPLTEAVVVIRIARNGTITKQVFEKRSNDPTFDQFVRKTLQDAAPLPPIPPALKKKSLEVGLRFTPEGIQ
jgi:colicin import membrane protein